MERGYVKLWRKTLDSGLIPHGTALQVFCWCLLRCAWKPTKYATRNGIIPLEPGQCVASRRNLSKEIGATERQIRTALDLLSKMEITTHQTTHEWTVITLTGWAKYQMDDRQTTHETTHYRPTIDPLSTQEEEGKKGSIKEENLKPLPAAKAARPPKATAPGFDAFWAAYPKRKGRKEALAEWVKASPPIDKVLEALAWQKKDEEWTKDGGKYILDPCRYIKRARWEDEKPHGRGTGTGDGYSTRQWKEGDPLPEF